MDCIKRKKLNNRTFLPTIRLGIVFLLFFNIYSYGLFGNAYNSKDSVRVRYFTLEDGLSQVSVNDLLRDSNGFVWIATQDGLNRFDGNEFKHFKYSAGDSMTISGNLTNKLLEDKTGKIWVGTIGNGLSYYDQKLDVFHRIKLQFSSDENEIISGLAEDKNGAIWVASRVSGLHQLVPLGNGTFSQRNLFSSSAFSALFLDVHNNLWVGDLDGNIYKLDPSDTQSSDINPELKVEGQIMAMYNAGSYLLIGTDYGFLGYDTRTKKIQLFEFEKSGGHSTKFISALLPANDNDVWVGTGSGLYLFDWVNKKAVSKIEYDQNANGLSNNTVQALLDLPNQQLLVGTANYLDLLDFKDPYFKNISKNNKGDHLISDNVVFSVFEDADDLWIGTSDGGLNLIRDGQQYYYKEDKNNPSSISGDVVRAIVKDKENQRLWLATTRGLSMIDLKTFDPDNPKFTVFHHNPDNINSLNGDFLKDLALDKNNNLWGATYGYGIFRLEISEKNEISITRYGHDNNNSNSLPNNFGQCIRVDDQNNIWIGTQGGLTKLSFANDNYDQPVFTNYFRNPNSKKTLSHNSVYDILINNSSNRVWAATRHGLNLFLGNNEFKSWTEQKQFPNAVVYSIQDDETGKLWLGTNDGIVRFDPENENFIHYGIEDGIQSKEFDIHAKYRTSNGYIYLGGIGGVTYFQPKDLAKIDRPVPIYFSQLQIKDQVITTRNAHHLLKKALYETDKLEIEAQEFPFYLKFSTIDFRLNKDVAFAYKLQPTDKEWNLLKDSEIQFLNLPTGHYTLLVNGISRGKVWEQPPLKLDLFILPPWWATWWAYGIYILIAGVIIYWLYRFQLSKKLAIAESMRLKEVNQLKNSLYTNITHEFRTPLTVILGMTDSLKTDWESKNWEAKTKSLEMIERNSNNLLTLVNEMLDLAKLESGSMELQQITADVIPFVKYLCESFQSFSQESDINLVVYSEIDELIMDFDTGKLSTIISNVLSNAIKFTPKGGKIIVHLNHILTKNNECFFVKVKDSGVGISEDTLPHIFNRFYQVDASTSRHGEGTGIGLALTKELVELMDGTISVKSTPGKGSEFIIELPISKSATEVTPKIDPPIQKPLISTNNNDNLNQLSGNHSELPLALIIEDNIDVVYYLRTCLKGKYKTLHAVNGNVGIEMACENIPDIVICDVMMPEKDGYEVCSTLKSDERTDHIPIIMLTAKVTDKDRLAGLSQGADAYLAKPFSIAELFIRLDQLIQLRKKMIDKIGNDSFNQFLKSKVENPESKFLQKVIKSIHKEIDNELFGPAHLARELNLSESQIYRKLKAISGKSTALFIRSVRLQKAKELIQTTDKSIAEIAYEVGFNDPSWFSRAFREEFGFAPSAIHK